MGLSDAATPAEWHGAACEACIESTFCLLWETGRGKSLMEARRLCEVDG